MGRDMANVIDKVYILIYYIMGFIKYIPKIGIPADLLYDLNC